jgi:hypothetical protein
MRDGPPGPPLDLGAIPPWAAGSPPQDGGPGSMDHLGAHGALTLSRGLPQHRDFRG